ncbi:MAG: hypothetical protein ACRD2S_03440 [Terriglobales bacterium]
MPKGAVVYATLLRPHMAKSAWSGILFGTGMWFVGNELLLPEMGLIKPNHRTFQMRADALGEHLKYGLTTELVYRQVLRSR